MNRSNDSHSDTRQTSTTERGATAMPGGTRPDAGPQKSEKPGARSPSEPSTIRAGVPAERAGEGLSAPTKR